MDFNVIMDDVFIMKEHLQKMKGSVLNVSMSAYCDSYDVFLSKEFYESIKEQFAGAPEYTKKYIGSNHYEKGFMVDGIKYFYIVEGDINEI